MLAVAPRLRPSEFLRTVADRLRLVLPPELAAFEWQHRGGLVKFWYSWPRLHDEVWFHRRIARLEIGLHFEADPTINARLLDWMSDNLVVAKAGISEWVEAEAWDRGWARVYEMLPIEPLDATFLNTVTHRLARTIVVLQPLLDDAVAEIGEPPPRVPVAAVESSQRRWHSRRRQGA